MGKMPEAQNFLIPPRIFLTFDDFDPVQRTNVNLKILNTLLVIQGGMGGGRLSSSPTFSYILGVFLLFPHFSQKTSTILP